MDGACLAAEKPGMDIETGGEVAHLEDRSLATRDGVGHIHLDLLLSRLHVDERKPLRERPLHHGTETRYGRKQRSGIGVLASMEYVAGPAGLHHFATEHDHGPVRDFGNDTHVMGDEKDGHPLLVLQRLDEIEDLALDGHVQRRRRLVGNEQLRLRRQGHRDHHALAHASRELVRKLVVPILRVRDSHLLQ